MSCSWSNRLPGLEESGNFFTGSPFGGSCACWVSKALVKSCSKESHFTSFYSVSLQEPVLPPCRARLLTNTPEVAGPRTSGVLSSKGIPRPLQQTVSHLFSGLFAAHPLCTCIWGSSDHSVSNNTGGPRARRLGQPWYGSRAL